MTDPYIKLAKSAIETYIRNGKKVTPPSGLPPKILAKKAGVFVSIHKKDGSLRGCIGTFIPTKKNIAQEIIANAIAAATQDPRFPPVTEKELPDLEISVDILSKPKLVKDTSEAPMRVAQAGRGGRLNASEAMTPPRWKEKLDPKKYGLIVSSKDGRKGLLLPDIPGVETAEQQIEICHRKAGISPKEPITIKVFTVERHCEDLD